jgi:drug/metabolite transporter (DMT)-like permease
VLRAHLALLGASSIWGLSYLATKTALRDMGPFENAAARMLLAAAVFLPVYLPRRRSLPIGRQLVAATLGVALYYALFNLGLMDARATDAGVIQASIPAVTALLAIPLLGERAPLGAWAGIGLSMIGVIALVAGTTGGGVGSLAGDVFIVASVLDWALYSIYIRRLAREVGDAAITAAALVVGAALLLPLGAAELAVVTPRLTVSGAIAVLYSGLAASALGYWLWSYGLARVPAAAATTYLNLLPLVAAISGALVLGERVGIVEAGAGVVIVAGVTLAAASARR